MVVFVSPYCVIGGENRTRVYLLLITKDSDLYRSSFTLIGTLARLCNAAIIYERYDKHEQKKRDPPIA